MIVDLTQSKIEHGLKQIRGWYNFLDLFDEVVAEVESERTRLAAGESDNDYSHGKEHLYFLQSC